MKLKFTLITCKLEIRFVPTSLMFFKPLCELQACSQKWSLLMTELPFILVSFSLFRERMDAQGPFFIGQSAYLQQHVRIWTTFHEKTEHKVLSWVPAPHIAPSTASIHHPVLVLKITSLSREAKHSIEGPLWEKGLITREVGFQRKKQPVQEIMTSTSTKPDRDFKVPHSASVLPASNTQIKIMLVQMSKEDKKSERAGIIINCYLILVCQ